MRPIPLILSLLLLAAFTIDRSLELVVIVKRGKTRSFDLNQPATKGFDLNKKPGTSGIDLNRPATHGFDLNKAASSSSSGRAGSPVSVTQQSTVTSDKRPISGMGSSSSVKGKGKAPSTSGGVKKTPQSQLDNMNRWRAKPENKAKVLAYARERYQKQKANPESKAKVLANARERYQKKQADKAAKKGR